METEGQIIFEKKREFSPKRKVKKGKIRIDIWRILFYGGVLIFLWFLFSYSYKSIVAFNDFYNLISVYSTEEAPSLNNILVGTPRDGDKISLPFWTRGKARPFENKLFLQIRDEKGGEILFKDGIDVLMKKGQFGSFSKKIESLNPLPSGKYILLEFYLESKEGIKTNLIIVPVELE